jgi:hypothetical protein
MMQVTMVSRDLFEQCRCYCTHHSKTGYTVAAPNAKASSSKVTLDSDDEMDFVPRAGPAKVMKPAAKAKASAKKAVQLSDEDESDVPPPKAKKVAPAKLKKKAVDSDDDDFDMDDS